MRVSSSFKAIFIIVNHVSATMVPHNIPKPTVDTGAPSGDVEPAVKSEPEVSARFASMDMFSLLMGRAPAKGGATNNAPKCDKCRKKCRPRAIKDKKNCSKCVPCPKGQKANKDWTQCVPEKEKPKEDKDKKKKEKENKYKKMKKTKQVEFKKKQYPKKKTNMKKKWDDLEKKREDNKNRIKQRFMGRCLTLVPLAMGGEFAKEFAGEYFDEAFLEHYAGDMLQHWPEGQQLAPWDKESDVDDGIFADEKFVDQFVKRGNDKSKRWLRDLHKRDPNATALAYGDEHGSIDHLLLDDDEIADVHSHQHYHQRQQQKERDDAIVRLAARANPLPYNKQPGDLIVRGDLEERFFWLIPIFSAIFSTLTRVAVAAARAAPALLRVAKDTVKVAAKRGSKNGFKKQADGFGKIAKEGKEIWKNCLKKMPPP
ncbi:hypothetical protein PG987_008800 [Apiospora arundinis]